MNQKKKNWVRRKVGVFGKASAYFLGINENELKYRENDTCTLFQFFKLEKPEETKKVRPHIVLHTFFIDDDITEDYLRELSESFKSYTFEHVGCKVGDDEQSRTIKNVVFKYEVEDNEDFDILMQELGKLSVLKPPSKKELRKLEKEKKEKRSSQKEKKKMEEEKDDIENPIFYSTLVDTKKKKKKPFVLRFFNSRSSETEVENVLAEKMGQIEEINQRISKRVEKRNEHPPDVPLMEPEYIEYGEAQEVRDSEISKPDFSNSEVLDHEHALPLLQKIYSIMREDKQIDDFLQKTKESEIRSQCLLNHEKSFESLRELRNFVDETKGDTQSEIQKLGELERKMEYFEEQHLPILQFLEGIMDRVSKYKGEIEKQKKDLEDSLKKVEDGSLSDNSYFQKYESLYRQLVRYRKLLMGKLLTHTLEDREENEILSKIVDLKMQLDEIKKNCSKNVLEVFQDPVAKKFAHIRKSVKNSYREEKKNSLLKLLECPITKKVMVEPTVLTATGESFEKKELQNHFSDLWTVDHPLRSGERIRSRGIIPNITLKRLISSVRKT